MNNLQKEIIKIVESSGSNGIKAKDIAKKFDYHLTKKEINRCLYGPLSKNLYRDSDYRWYSDPKFINPIGEEKEITIGDNTEVTLNKDFEELFILAESLGISEGNLASLLMLPSHVVYKLKFNFDNSYENIEHLRKLISTLSDIKNEADYEIIKDINSNVSIKNIFNQALNCNLELETEEFTDVPQENLEENEEKAEKENIFLLYILPIIILAYILLKD